MRKDPATFMFGIASCCLAVALTGVGGCTSAPTAPTDKQAVIANAVEDTLSIGLVPVLVKNPDYITAFDGGITLDTGITGTSNKFVSARSLATPGFFRDVSASLVPESATASTNIYWKKSGATTQGQVEITLTLERAY